MNTAYYTKLSNRNRIIEEYAKAGKKGKPFDQMWIKFNRNDPSTGNKFAIRTCLCKANKKVTVKWRMPAKSPQGKYRIEVFIPGKNADTQQARYKVRNGLQQSDEQNVALDQSRFSDKWVPLGEYELSPTLSEKIGRVTLVDKTDKAEKGKHISFGPVRWVPLFEIAIDSLRFDSPVGTQAERDGPIGIDLQKKNPQWTKAWRDANPYLNWYFNGYHTGSDLNSGDGADDKGKPVHAVADGVVTFAEAKAGGWGGLIVIRHAKAIVQLANGDLQTANAVFSRYGHVMGDEILVNAGEAVLRGQRIGSVGTQPKVKPPQFHLHFDISHTNLLEDSPRHWPNLSKIKELREKLSEEARKTDKEFINAQATFEKEVKDHYLDPLEFLQMNRGQE